ncbi:response regulator [Acidipila sp. EB88]|uniref:response regulator n=1 Tax=Acidipila sp. EB88 TaxID=2305226 RepID=UPI000F5F3D62|nr:response regulator [Acidipila sp. EB88]RRA48092.1 response regulator [Acidipila sp. EB88]
MQNPKSTILFIDDDPTLRMIGKLLLESQGYEVVCAEGGQQAMAILESHLPDLIISDLHIPMPAGGELLPALRREYPAIPVVVVSGDPRIADGPEMLSLLADACFLKGAYRPPELFAMLARLLQSPPVRPTRPQAEIAPPAASGEGSKGPAGIVLGGLSQARP